MSREPEIVAVQHSEAKLKLSSYLAGFGLSIFLTLASYLLVTHQALSHHLLLVFVVGLALVQFFVQAFFFLHLGQETKPRWKLAVFFFMVGVVLILVFGSIWIMYNINSRMTIPQQLRYLNSQDEL